jgi:hypothetical protein
VSGDKSVDEGVLEAVTALSPTDAWAAGYRIVQGGGQTHLRTLIEHWDGLSWTAVPSPNVGTSAANVLHAVTSIGGTLWAVGEWRKDNLSTQHGLILRYRHGRWRIVRSPDGVDDTALFGVSGPSQSDVWAVGSVYGVGAYALHWDGDVWTQRPTPDLDADVFKAVDATAPGGPVAVGSVASSTPGQRLTLVEQWDGAAWNVVPSFNPSEHTNDLFGVASSGAGESWAVGQYDPPVTPPYHLSLAERPVGGSWEQAPTSNPGEQNDTLMAVASVRSSFVAAGYEDTKDFREHVLIERRIRSSWESMSVPDAGLVNTAYGVAATSRSDIWAVGSYQMSAAAQPLILHGCI